jgi:hypothetical protein
LEIGVRTNGSTNLLVILSPRQSLIHTPYALHAASATTAATTTGAITSSQLPANVARLDGSANFSGTITAGGFHGDGSGLTNISAAGTVADANAVQKANNGADFLNLTKTRNNLGILDIAAQTGDSTPETAWTNARAAYPNQIGIVRNGGFAGLYISRSTDLGDFSGNWLFNGFQTIGTQYEMAPYAAPSLVVGGNGNRIFQQTNGPLGAENIIVVEQFDPKQATYIAFSAPKGIDTNGNVVMSPWQDFQVGMGSKYYGQLTLGGVAIGNDALIALNPGHDFYFTTTANLFGWTTNNGCRVFLGYDNAADVWHFPWTTVNAGAPNNTGWRDSLTVNQKTGNVTVGNNFAANGSMTGNGSGLTNIPLAAVAGLPANLAGKAATPSFQTITNSSDPGLPGQIVYDNAYVYLCTATNTWRRTTTATW